MSVADLLSGTAVALASGGVAAFDQPAIRQELADARETLDLVDLVEHRHRKDSADSGDRLQAKEVLWIVQLGTAFQEQFELANRVVVLPQQFKVELDGSFGAGMLEAISDAGSIRFVSDLFGERFVVVLVVDDLNVRQRLGSKPHQMSASSEQVTGRAELGWVGVGGGEVASSQ